MTSVTLPPIEGVTLQIQREFVKPLRRPLTGFRLFAGKEFRTDSWTREELKWFSTSDMTDAVVSMDLPPISNDGVTLTPRSVTIPLLTKDLTMGGRKAAQATEAGLDPTLVDSQARALAVEMERALLVGYPAKSGGPVTGLLNDANSPVAVALGAWTDATAVNDGIAKLIQAAVLAEQYGPYALVVPRSEVALYQKFIGTTNVRIGENLPGNLPGSVGGITAILPSIYENAGYVQLINLEDGNYHAVAPKDEPGLRFGLGTVTVGEVARTTLITDSNPIMMSRTWRALNIIVPRVVHPEAVITGTHT